MSGEREVWQGHRKEALIAVLFVSPIWAPILLGVLISTLGCRVKKVASSPQPATAAPTPEPPVQFRWIAHEDRSSLGCCGIRSICDTREGHLLYVTTGPDGRMAMAVVPGGCKK